MKKYKWMTFLMMIAVVFLSCLKEGTTGGTEESSSSQQVGSSSSEQETKSSSDPLSSSGRSSSLQSSSSVAELSSSGELSSNAENSSSSLSSSGSSSSTEELASYNMKAVSTSVIVNTTMNFYDDGGGSADYSLNFSGSLNFVSGIEGKVVQLDFQSFDLETFFDKFSLDGTDFSMGESPGKYVSPNTDGTVLVDFTSDDSSVGTGWYAIVSLVDVP